MGDEQVRIFVRKDTSRSGALPTEGLCVGQGVVLLWSGWLWRGVVLENLAALSTCVSGAAPVLPWRMLVAKMGCALLPLLLLPGDFSCRLRCCLAAGPRTVWWKGRIAHHSVVRLLRSLRACQSVASLRPGPPCRCSQVAWVKSLHPCSTRLLHFTMWVRSCAWVSSAWLC